jgi:hypothetical protein
MELEDIMSNETSQAQKDKYHIFLLILDAKTYDFIEKESRVVITRD